MSDDPHDHGHEAHEQGEHDHEGHESADHDHGDDHGEHEAGAHELDEMPNGRLFNLLIGLSAVTFVASVAVVQLVNAQYESILHARNLYGSSTHRAYLSEMRSIADGYGKVAMREGTETREVYYVPVTKAKEEVLRDRNRLSALPAYPGWNVTPTFKKIEEVETQARHDNGIATPEVPTGPLGAVPSPSPEVPAPEPSTPTTPEPSTPTTPEPSTPTPPTPSTPEPTTPEPSTPTTPEPSTPTPPEPSKPTRPAPSKPTRPTPSKPTPPVPSTPTPPEPSTPTPPIPSTPAPSTPTPSASPSTTAPGGGSSTTPADAAPKTSPSSPAADGAHP